MAGLPGAGMPPAGAASDSPGEGAAETPRANGDSGEGTV